VSADFDPKKDAANVKKHGVSLSEGDGVLSDPLALTVEDDSAEGEQRERGVEVFALARFTARPRVPRFARRIRTLSRIRRPIPETRKPRNS